MRANASRAPCPRAARYNLTCCPHARPRSPCRMHRVSVFRDDVVFVVYMYQRFFLYPVDHSRAAEGFDDDDDSRAAEGKKAAVKAAAVAALPKPPSPSLKMD